MRHTNNKRSVTKQAKSKESTVRIIAGAMRGRKVIFSPADGLRPTLDQVRETLFNWLAPDIHDSLCLDLYAGSGALGFEALSRGATSVIFVEANQKTSNYLKQNLKDLAITNARIETKKAEDFLAKNNQKYDLVFIDPPFEKGMLESILHKVKPHLTDTAMVYIEHETGSNIDIAEEWLVLKSKQTSRFRYSLLKLK